MAKTGMSPIERLAKGLVKPVVVKQTTPTPSPSTTVPSVKTPAQKLAELRGSSAGTPTTSSSATPLKTYLSDPLTYKELTARNALSPATNAPGNKPFTGPTLDPDIIDARDLLKGKAEVALNVGVPPATVQSIASGQGDPDRGFLGPWNDIKKGLKAVYNYDFGDTGIKPFVKVANFDPIKGDKEFKPVKAVGTIAKGGGKKLLEAAAPALDKLDFGRRMITSLLKEVGDEGAALLGNRPRGKTGFKAGPGGFSWNDFINQGFAGEFGLGETYKADDPAIIAEAAQYDNMTPKQLADMKNKDQAVQGGDFFREIDNPYANQLLGLFADIFFDPLTYGTGPGGIAKTAINKGVIKGSAEFVAKAVAAEADRLAASVAKKAAEEALSLAIANGDDVAAAAAKATIKDATATIKETLKVTSSVTPVRTGGRTSNQALADSVLQIKDDAQRLIDADVTGNIYTDAAREGAQRTIDVLTPEVIKDIQASGLAGIAGSYLDIIKGTRTAAQDVLGVRGGLRLGVPGARVTVKGTETIQTLAGKLASDLRLGFLKTPGAKSLFSKLTPTGEGGLLGSEDLLRLRTGLRQNTLGANEAEDATRLISLDNAYRAAVQQARRTTGGYLDTLGLVPKYSIEKGARVLTTEGYDPKLLNGIIEHLQGIKSPATLAGKELEAYNKIRGALDNFYDEAVVASKATGYVPPRRANYFPQMRSDDALRWAERNPGAAVRLADKLGVDRTWFIGNFQARDLKAKDNWFGYELDATDLNLNRLNEIAKSPSNTNAAGKTFPNPQAVKFDFFETDVLKVLSKYANTHAQFVALQKTLGDLPSQYPSLFRKDDFSVFVPGTGPMIKEARGVFPRIGTPDFPGIAGKTLTPGVPFDANTILQALDAGELQTLIDDVKAIITKARKPLVLKDDIDAGMNQLQTKLDQIQADYASGVLTPPAAATLTDEVKLNAQLLVNDLDRVAPILSNAPVDKWVEYVSVVRDGFESLNNITAPDIAVRADIAQLFTDAARMGDKQFAGVVRQAVNDYIKFSKAYLVARPGFHVRNGLSNAFTVVAAGANLEAIRTGPYLSTAINRGLKAGKTPEQIAESLVDNYLSQQRGFVFGRTPVVDLKGASAFSSTPGEAREAIVRALTDAINYSGSTGFGQFGEIAEAVGKTNRGFLQAGDPANKLSAGFGKVLQKSREFGTGIEDVSRFTLTWDGLLKGLTPQQAIARTNKYLIDYGDYSKLDKFGRLIFPFWTFMTRNAPMQLELMLTNPKVYAQYNAFRRNLEDTRSEEEGGVAIPFYEKERGVFATKEEGFGSLIPGNVIRPGLPFEGGGENVLSGLLKNPRQVLANVNPIFRAPLEAFARGEDGRGAGFFTDAPIVPTTELTYPTRSKFLYLAREVLSPTSPIRSILQATPARRIELLQTLLGMKSDPNDPLTQEMQAAFSYGGLPFGVISTEQQLREINSRIYKLADKIEILNKQEKAIIRKEETKTEAESKNNPVAIPSGVAKTPAEKLAELRAGTTTVP
jgi:hypothetical protein